MHNRGHLSQLWKKIALPVALASTVVAGINGPASEAAPVAAAQTGTIGQHLSASPLLSLLTQEDATKATSPPLAAPATVADPTAAPATPAPAPVLSREERARNLMFEEARKNFDRVAALAETSYSRDLQRLETRLTLSVRADSGSIQDHVVVLDPYLLDAAAAVTNDPREALSVLLSQQHVRVAPELIEGLKDHAFNPYINRMTPNVYAQDPAALPSIKTTAKGACVIVPTNNFNQPLTIPGLSLDQRINFINRHEGWHCMDSRLKLMDSHYGENAPKFDVNTAIADDKMLTDISTNFRKESLADVAAVGDMIRQDNVGMGLIDKIIAWRTNPADPQHMSMPVLQALKTSIQQMGLPAFKALSDAKATDLYYNLTTQNQLGMNGVRFLLVVDNITPAQRADMAAKFSQDPEYKKAMALREVYTRPVKDPGFMGGPLTAEEIRIQKEVLGFNAGKLLQDTAFQRARKITPVTMIAAYATLQEGLMARMRAEPDNAVIPVLMTKLQNTFVMDTRNIDYLKVNAARGVDLTKTEPSLAHFNAHRPQPPKRLPMAAAPSPGTGVN